MEDLPSLNLNESRLGCDLPHHAAAVLFAAKLKWVSAAVGRSVEIAGGVEGYGPDGIGPFAVVEVVEIDGGAGLIAIRRHLEDPAVTEGTTLVTYPVQIAVGAERYAGGGGAGVKGVNQREVKPVDALSS